MSNIKNDTNLGKIAENCIFYSKKTILKGTKFTLKAMWGEFAPLFPPWVKRFLGKKNHFQKFCSKTGAYRGPN